MKIAIVRNGRASFDIQEVQVAAQGQVTATTFVKLLNDSLREVHPERSTNTELPQNLKWTYFVP